MLATLLHTVLAAAASTTVQAQATIPVRCIAAYQDTPEGTHLPTRVAALIDAGTLRTTFGEQIAAAWIQAPRGAWSYWRALPMLVVSVHAPARWC